MTTHHLRGLKILVVDDEAEILENLASIVGKLGFTAVTACNGQTAWEIIQNEGENIALVISDLRMPVLDGLELRKAMLEQWKAIPFVVLSSMVTKELALQALEYRISAFLDKPCENEAVIAVIQKESQDRVASLIEEAQMLAAFVSEAEVMTEEMESLILSLESDPSDPETVNRIFTFAHTIKGSSGFFTPDTVHRFTHKYEDYLSKFKTGVMAITPESVGVLLRGLDIIKKQLWVLKTKDRTPQNFDELLLVFEPSKAAKVKMPAANGPSPVASPAKKEEIRIATHLLDEFMELSGEITVIRNMINKLVKTIEKEQGGNKNIISLSDLVEEMHKINSSMQDKIIDLRKVSLKNVFKPLPRTLRDLAISLKKEIAFKIEGDDLRVDTSLAEALSSSLIHMVRNSADHGIELPSERERAGKSPQGTLLLTARENGDEVVIRLEDDGKGLNPDIIKKKILEKNLKTQEQVEKMTLEEIHLMIFEPGFSTAAQVTDISGRGVGTDMVKKSVVKLGGRIDVQSDVGKGTQFEIHLPIPKSASIIASLMVRIHQQIFAIPQEAITRLIVLDAGNQKLMIRNFGGFEFIEIQGELCPIIDLEKILDPSISSDRSRSSIVLLNSDQHSYGVWVEEILDVEDTVVKRLDRTLKNIPAYSGATFLDDARVGLILNVNGLAKMAHLKPSAANSHVEQKSELKSERAVLVFDMRVSGIFGVFLDDVYRLEEIECSELQKSGNEYMIFYRDTLMPVKCLAHLMGYSKTLTFSETSGRLSLFVVRTGKNYLGLAVKNILDLVTARIEIDLLVKDRSTVLGASVVNGKTITLVEIDVVRRLALPLKNSGRLELAA